MITGISALATLTLAPLSLAPLSPALAQESYRPPLSKPHALDTIIVHADGTHERIIENTERIESELGVSEYGQRILSYNGTFEELEILEAATIGPSGERMRVDPQAIRTVEEELSGGVPMFSDMKNKVVVYPNVRVGSLLYLKARSRQHTPHFGNAFFLHEVFSPHVRYGHAEYHVIVHPSVTLQISSQGMRGGEVDADADAQAKGPQGYRHYRFTYSQDFAHPSEPAQMHYSYFAPHLMLTTFADYIALGRAYERYAAPKTRVTEAIKALADDITRGIEDERGQARALYHWVARNIRYVAIYLGDGGFEPHDVETILKNRYGDCKDYVVLLQSLLAAKGISASPALVNAGAGEALSPVAVTFPLNHVMLYIPSLDLYLDPTAQFARFGVLPEAVMNKPVVLTSLDRLARTPKMLTHEHRTISKMQIDMLADGKLRGRTETEYQGSPETEARSRHFDREGRSPERTVRRLLSRFNEMGFGVISDSDPMDISAPFALNASFELDPPVNIPGPSAMMVPVGLSSGRIASMAHTKPLALRRFPTGCSSEQIIEETEIRFHESVQVTRIPLGVRYDSPSITYTSSYTLVKADAGQVLRIKRELTMQHDSGTCSPTDAQHWSDFHPTLYRDVRAQIFVQ